jgi:predicted Zn-dependent peptidase
MAFKTKEVGDSSLYALDIAEGVLNGRSGRLYKRLVEEEQLAVWARARNSPNKYVSEFSIQAELKPEADFQKVEKIIWEELDKLKKESLVQRDFEKVKNRAYASLVRSLTDMENVATMLAWYEMFGDYRIFLNWAKVLEQVSPDEVKAVAQNTFLKNQATIGILKKGAF